MPDRSRIMGPFSWSQWPAAPIRPERPTVVALGTFDGVHRGHQAIVRHALTLKKDLLKINADRAVDAIAFTFDKLPLELLRPKQAPARLMTADQRSEVLLSLGLDGVFLAAFDEDFARLKAEHFLTKVLRDTLNAAGIVVGFNHTFGHRGQGNVDLLQRFCRDNDIALHIVEGVTLDGRVISSTGIRQMLQRGDVTEASRLLGRPHTLIGTVVHGHKQGRKLGFPTANLHTAPGVIVPADGVYLSAVSLGETALGHAVTVVSDRPTFAGDARTVEVHIIGYEGDVYGQTLHVSFLEMLRGISRFSGPDALKRQMSEDVALATERATRYNVKETSFTSPG